MTGERQETDTASVDRRRVLYALGAGTATALAGCQSGGDESDSREESDTPESTKTATREATPTPQNLSTDVAIDLPSTATNTESVEMGVEFGNPDAVDDYALEIEDPAGDVHQLDDPTELETQHITDTAGEYQFTLTVETRDGETTEYDESLEVTWLKPDNVDSGVWEALLAEVDSPDKLYQRLTNEDGEFTETGHQAGQVLGKVSLDDEIRHQLADAVLSTDAELTEYDLGILNTVLANPTVQKGLVETTIREEFSDYMLERTGDDSNLEMTKLEKELIFGIEDESNLEHLDQIQELRDLLLGEGYTQKETNYLRTVGKYDSKTINNINPRIEQAKEHGLFTEVIQNEGEIDEDFLHKISDYKDNGLISERDPAPQQFSATPDPIATGFVKDMLGDDYDPEEPLAIFMYDISNEANPEVVPEALNVMQNEYEEAGIQTLLIQGSENVDTLGEGDLGEISDRASANASRRLNSVDLDALHYILFDEYELTESDYTAWGINDDGSLGHCVVHTDPYELPNNPHWSKQGAINDALMAETLDSLVDGSFDHKDYYRTFEPDSEAGEKSWTSFDFGGFNPDNKEIVPGEYEDIMDEGLNYDGDRGLQRALMGAIDTRIEADRPSADRFRVEEYQEALTERGEPTSGL